MNKRAVYTELNKILSAVFCINLDLSSIEQEILNESFDDIKQILSHIYSSASKSKAKGESLKIDSELLNNCKQDLKDKKNPIGFGVKGEQHGG